MTGQGLSEGGTVEIPSDRQFWGDYFGSFTDRFGIRWMVEVADPEAQAQQAASGRASRPQPT